MVLTPPRRSPALFLSTTIAVAATLATASPAVAAPARPIPAAAPVVPAAPAAPVGPAALSGPARHVVAISIDGLNSKAIRVLGTRRTPNFHTLMAEGTGTLNARTAYEMTVTLPNHTGMLTGRRITASKGGHGIDVNTDDGRTTVHQAAGEYVASVFDVVHDNGGSTALFSAKEKFALFRRTWTTSGAVDRTGPDNGRSKIDRVVLDTDNTRLVKTVTSELAANPRTFTFLHISLPDVAGHEHGFMGRRYLRAVERSDILLGRVLRTIGDEPGLRGRTALVLTADHGGSGGTSHSKADKLANYRVPFLVWGEGVSAGANLYAVNRDYRSPGARRPTYSGRQPIRNGDLANVSTDLLGLPAVPGSMFDDRQDIALTR